MKRRLIAVGKVAVAAGLIAWLLRSGRLDPARLGDAFLSGGPWVFVGCLGVFACVFTGAVRWHFLLRALGVRHPFGYSLRLTFMGSFFSMALPGSVGGDVIKAYYVCRREKNRAAVIASVILDRVFGLCALFPVAAAAVLAWPGLAEISPALRAMSHLVLAVAVGLALVAVLILSRRVRESRLARATLARMPGQRLLRSLREGAGAASANRLAALTALGAAMAIPVMIGATYAAFGRSLGGQSLPFASFLFASPFVNMAMALPIAPAGIGTGQAAAMKIFEWILRRPSSFGADLITLLHLTRFVAALVGAVVYLRFEERLGLAELESRAEAAAAQADDGSSPAGSPEESSQ